MAYNSSIYGINPFNLLAFNVLMHFGQYIAGILISCLLESKKNFNECHTHESVDKGRQSRLHI